MSNRKKRAAFNREWRKARKVLRRCQMLRAWMPEEVQLALRYNIDILGGERVK